MLAFGFNLTRTLNFESGSCLASRGTFRGGQDDVGPVVPLVAVPCDKVFLPVVPVDSDEIPVLVPVPTEVA